MDCDVKSKGSDRVVYEVLHKSWVVFNGEREGDVDFLVWRDSGVVTEAPVKSHIVDQRRGD
jgi:hypothetical protein